MNFFAKLGVCFLAIILLILSFAGLASFSLGEYLLIKRFFSAEKYIFDRYGSIKYS